jgi:hypothetical protein
MTGNKDLIFQWTKVRIGLIRNPSLMHSQEALINDGLRHSRESGNPVFPMYC